MIVKYFKKYEFNWEKMATHFRRRTPIMLKNRYYAHIRKKELTDSLFGQILSIEKDGENTVDALY